MAIAAAIRFICEVTGLSVDDLNFPLKFNTTTTPTAITHQYRTQATADTAEALDLGDISTVELIVIKSITNDLDIDCDYVSSFDGDIEVQEGEGAIFKPKGTVYIKNTTSEETCVYEYVCIGTT